MVLALTRIISAVFRKGGDVTFLVEELRSVFDPSGGYFKKGGKFMPSLVAEIGEVIETHMKLIGLIKDEAMDETAKRFSSKRRLSWRRRKALNRPPPTFQMNRLHQQLKRSVQPVRVTPHPQRCATNATPKPWS